MLLKGTWGRKGKKEVKEVAALQKLGGSKQQGGFQKQLPPIAATAYLDPVLSSVAYSQ